MSGSVSGKRHAVVIGQGVVGCAVAIEAIRAGMRVTVVEPEPAGGEHASSYGNSGWLPSHSVIPPALPGAWRKMPSSRRRARLARARPHRRALGRSGTRRPCANGSRT